LLTLNYRDSRPIYGQIKDGLRRMIVTGALEPDEKLPSVRSMAVDLAINPNTIQRAYAELEAEGFIYSVPGKGSFASRRMGTDPTRQAELVRRLRELVAELRYLGLKDSEIISLMNEGVAQ
jgi:GntR family transcriptional regulator